jgi:hypothetical protein
MTKVTYLLGAGASAEVLPLAKTIRDEYTGNEKPGLGRRMSILAEEIKNSLTKLNSEEKDYADIFIENLFWLSREAETHGTVDTFAKKLFLQNQSLPLVKLKKTLSLFLIIEQNTKGFDKRYTSFFASILERRNNEIILPSSIKVLTWNYDIQLEMAYQYYHRLDSTSDIKSVQWAMKSKPASGVHNAIFKDPNVVHLNGIAGLYNKDHEGNTGDFYDRINDSNNQLLVKVLQHTLFLIKDLGRDIFLADTFQFAWEINQSKPDSIVEDAKKISGDTDILVIIGYSFPFFNRNVDREIFKSLKATKIYFQDPILDGSFLKEQFNLDKDILIVHRKETNQFFLPHEL